MHRVYSISDTKFVRKREIDKEPGKKIPHCVNSLQRKSSQVSNPGQPAQIKISNQAEGSNQ